MKKLTTSLVVLAVILLGSAALLFVKIARMPQSQVRTEPESAEVRNASIRAAFAPGADRTAGPNAVTDPALLAEVGEFFSELGAAFRDADAKAIDHLFSAGGMVSFMEGSGAIDLRSESLIERVFTREAMIEGIRLAMREETEAEEFSDPDLRRVERLGDNELLAYIIVYDTSYADQEHMRWWLLRHPDGHWQAYDSEDLESPIRDSDWYAAFLGAAYDLVPWEEELDRFTELAYAEDVPIESMVRTSEAMLAHQPPPALEIHVRMALADALESAGEEEEAIGHYDVALELSGGSAMVRNERGFCHWYLSNHALARDDLEAYAASYGWDESSREAVADCYYQLGKYETALKFAEAGLAESPQSGYLLGIFAAAAPPERHGEIATRLAEFDDREDAYGDLLNYCSGVREKQVYDLVRSMLKSESPGSGLLEIYAAEPEAEE
ncbi:MAG: tetratricopeptide repeat protein [Verrucomicrobiales bacterium]